MKNKYLYLYSLYSFASVFYLIMAWGGIDNSITDSKIYICGVLLILLYIITFVTFSRLWGSYINVFNLFLIYVFFSCCGQTFLNVIGVHEHWFIDVYALYSNEQIIKFLLFQYSCILALGIGAIASATRKNNSYYDSSEYTYALPHVVCVAYNIFCVVIYFLLIQRIAARLTSGYELYSEDNLSFLWFFFLIFYSAVLIKGNAEKSRHATINGIVLIGLTFILGIRTYAISIIAILLYKYQLSNDKKSAIPSSKKILFVVIGGIILISANLVTHLRDTPLYLLTIDSIVEIMNPFSSIRDIISEMGASAVTVVRTMNTIEDIGYRETIAYNCLESIIPHFILNLFFEKPDVLVEGLGNWCTFHAGPLLTGNSNLGFSFLAEMYLNFGYFAFFFTGIYGYILSEIERKSIVYFEQNKVLPATLFLVFISKNVFYARAQFSLMVDPIRYMILIYLFSWLFKSMLKHKNAR